MQVQQTETLTEQMMRGLAEEATAEVLRSISSRDLQPWRLQALKEQLVDCVGQLVMDQPVETEHLLQDVLRAIDRAGLALIARPA